MQGLRDIDWQLETKQAGYSNAEGSQAAEALALTSRGRATPQGEDWQVQASLAARGGMLYSDPLYLEFSAAQPLEFDAQLRWRTTAAELLLDSLDFRQPGVTRGRVEGVLAPGAERPLRQPQLLGQQLAEARERAARYETEAKFLRERLREMRATPELHSPVDPSPSTGDPATEEDAPPEKMWRYVYRGWSRRRKTRG